MATLQDLERALVNADAAGDVQSATALATEIRRMRPASVSAGQEINSIPRQLGLTARYGIEGIANAAQLVTEPIRAVTDLFTPERRLSTADLVTGKKAPPKSMPLGAVASQFADTLGLPKPEGANERVVGDAARLMAGAGGMGGAARLASAAPGAVGQAGQFLSSNMGQQVASAAGAGLAGGASREAGGSPLMQGAAALGGGVAAGLAPGAAQSAVNAGRSFINSFRPQQLDVQVQAAMQRAGVDWAQLPPRVQQSLRQDLADALNAGRELDPAAVRRLADFRLVGATPTRGMVSQDPVQITREMNLAKTGANSADQGLQGLARVQNQNNATFIRNLDEAGALQGDQFRAGAAAVGSINARDTQLERGVSSLYQQARDTSGRAADLDRAAFSRRVSELLDEAMVGGALPKDVENKINWIASNAKPQGMHGSIPMPFNVDIAEQLKTQIAKLQRNTSDGSARHALGLVRQALDEAPLMQAPKVNQSNLPAVPGTVPPSTATLGQQSIDAFNQARGAARDRFQWRESARPIDAAVNGAQPDKFVQQFVLNGTLDDARAVAQNAPVSEVKNAILAHLKDKALNGATSEVGKFSQSAYNKALRAIGDRKLSLFFTPEEITQLRAVGRVASYAQVQPVGSAVNNSNSGALLLGKGLDALAGFSNSLPVIGPMVSQPITNGIQGLNLAIRTNQAQNVAPGLLMQQPRRPLAQGLLLPGMAAGGTAAGLLAAP
jgi:hypothetical protein